MKKYFILVAVLASVISCQKEANVSTDGKLMNVSFSAALEDNSTKVNYTKEASCYKGTWVSGDKISLISYNNENAEFTNSTKNMFSGSVTPWSGNKDIYAVYPYNSTPYTISDNKLTFDASVQDIAAGDANYANTLMVAKSNGSSSSLPGMCFKQAMAIVKLDITNVPSDVTVTKVAVINQDMYSNQTLVKSASINMADGTIDGTPAYTNNVVGTVTGATAGAETIVNFALLPTTTAAKYSFCVTLSNGDVYKKTLATAATFARNTMYTVAYDLASVKKEDILVMVNYTLDNTAVDISGYQRTMNGGVNAQTNASFGYINKTNRSDGSTPIDAKFVYCDLGKYLTPMVNGYSIETWVRFTSFVNG